MRLHVIIGVKSRKETLWLIDLESGLMESSLTHDDVENEGK